MSEVELLKEILLYIKGIAEGMDAVKKDISNILGNITIWLSNQIPKILNAEEQDGLFMTEEVVVPAPKKVDMGRTYTYMSKKGTPYTCNKCKGFISWELRPERSYPLHVDKEGQIINDGNCPDYSGGS